MSKILDLPVDTIMVVEEDYDIVRTETLEEHNLRLNNMTEEEKKNIGMEDVFFKHRIENKRILTRIAKNNLEDIVNKLIDLYKEYTKNEQNRRGCFHIEGVELVKTTDNIPVSTENIVAIRFYYGT